jgi:hypothetical protein
LQAGWVHLLGPHRLLHQVALVSHLFPPPCNNSCDRLSRCPACNVSGPGLCCNKDR